MSYYKKVLQSDENVKYVGRLHWIVYKNAISFLILGIASFILWFMYINAQPAVDRHPVSVLMPLSPFVVAGLSFVASWFVRVNTEIVVTDKRIIYKTGWISRSTEEMNITKVESVDVVQGITGRILGFGTVGIHGTGALWEPLRKVDSPLKLRNAILIG